MNKDLDRLDAFVTGVTAKGLITMKVYLDLKESIYRLESILNDKEKTMG